MEDWGEESDDPLPIEVGGRDVSRPDLPDPDPDRAQDWGTESKEADPPLAREPD